jgi:hypothetical protein
MWQLWQQRKGMALILCMLAMIAVMGIITITYINLESSHVNITTIIATKGQAVSMAQAGLVDGINWFRLFSQNTSPVFIPSNDDLVQTEDPYIGLVREHVLSDKPLLKGRYEIRKAPHNRAVEETIGQRLSTSNKPVFYLPCHGFIFEPINTPTYTYTALDFYLKDGSGNPLIGRYDFSKIKLHASSIVSCEVIKTQIDMPYSAALCHLGNVTVNTDGEIKTSDAGAKAIARSLGGSATVTRNGTGVINPYTPPETTYPAGEDNTEMVFGVDETTLSTGNDKVVFPTLPTTLKIPEYKYTFIGTPNPTTLPTFTFNSTTPLTGTNAVVYIAGHAVLSTGNNSFFMGILYVKGNLTINGPAQLGGCIIVKGNTIVQGGASDKATIVYQKSIVDNLQQMMAQYSYYRAPFVETKESTTLTYGN